ncbi:uncharacterized protein BXZ73DRAFT_75770 [Epithele typhae]|uniref:uncharacterized protein n=1 Tax=Epithele typhae TaxID=378194 RepID=UPI0020085696|nr:uncharacterized protein BXZ73DRAFT_75770 [Epithele typhae]KAH9940171.1 hypothetical protein BXZ73DRAFT_75770 [Epithele typhae]
MPPRTLGAAPRLCDFAAASMKVHDVLVAHRGCGRSALFQPTPSSEMLSRETNLDNFWAVLDLNIRRGLDNCELTPTTKYFASQYGHLSTLWTYRWLPTADEAHETNAESKFQYDEDTFVPLFRRLTNSGGCSQDMVMSLCTVLQRFESCRRWGLSNAQAATFWLPIDRRSTSTSSYLRYPYPVPTRLSVRGLFVMMVCALAVLPPHVVFAVDAQYIPIAGLPKHPSTASCVPSRSQYGPSSPSAGTRRRR